MSDTQPRRHFLLGSVALGAGAPLAAKEAFDVTGFGATHGGAQLDTEAIQKAIDKCAESGGGMVYFPAGSYLSGGLRMRSHVHLYLDAGAILLGSKRLEDFPVTRPSIRSYTDNYTERSLIYGEGVADVGIHGQGTLDGQGAAYEGPYKVRPYMIRITSSKDVTIGDVTIRNSPMWVQHYLACDNVIIRGIRVHSRVNANNDGIDIDGCHGVSISDCNISSGDDAIVLKSTLDRATRDVAITNCVLSSHCNAFKLGTESNGGFENIVLSGCTMYDTRLSGIAIEMVDGGLLDGVHVSNITMRDVKSTIFIRLGNRARPFAEGDAKPGVGRLRNIQISNVRARGASTIGCAISGIPGHNIENVSIDSVHLSFEGGVSDGPDSVPENEAQYPEHKMFGILPAYGFFCRHVRNIRFRGVQTDFEKRDTRPALVADDVRDLDIADSVFAARDATIRLRQTADASIRGCRTRDAVRAFVDTTPGSVERLTLVGNDLALAETAVAGSTEALFMEANRTA